MVSKNEKMFRLNTYITKEQSVFIKAKAKAENKSEGSAFREILQLFITNTKK